MDIEDWYNEVCDQAEFQQLVGYHLEKFYEVKQFTLYYTYKGISYGMLMQLKEDLYDRKENRYVPVFFTQIDKKTLS